MDIQIPESFNVLFEEDIFKNIKNVFGVVKKCIEFSTNEREVLRALEISFGFGLKVFSLDKIEDKIFQYACPVARKLFCTKIECLENQAPNSNIQTPTSTYFELLNVCCSLLSYFNSIFIQLNDFQKIEILQIESLLFNSVKILYICFCHCNVSEKVYGDHFSSVTEHLSSCFQKCCELQESVLNILMNKLVCEFKESRESSILTEILMQLANSGLVLMNLDVKTMAKVWKTFIYVSEKHLNFIKSELNVGIVLRCLCETIINSAENCLLNHENQECNRMIKLACFNMKLVVKCCELFSGFLESSSKFLMDLLLSLCWCNACLSEDTEKKAHKDILQQLTFAVDPLISCLLTEKNLVKEFDSVSKQFSTFGKKYKIFSLLCCLVLKKLINQDKGIRELWFNDNFNILECLFLCVSNDQYNITSIKVLPSLVSSIGNGSSKRLLALYEYILVMMSAFIMTSTSLEFCLIEKTLIRNVMQQKPLCALLAIDVWCLLARFSDTDLCFNQIMRLSEMLQCFRSNTIRVEKLYLILLIQRLFPLLTLSQKEKFKNSFLNASSSELLKIVQLNNKQSGWNLYLIHNLNNPTVCQIESLIFENKILTPVYLNQESPFLDYSITQNETHVQWVVKLWKLNFTSLSSIHNKESFLKILCLVTASILPYASSETLLTIFSKIKNILLDKSVSIKLYVTWILGALSVIILPSNDFQEDIMQAVSEIFSTLLTCDNVLLKQKAMENFYEFSHVTSHAKIIALSVRNSAALKLNITNYFQKKVCDQESFEIDNYVGSLFKHNFKHNCLFNSSKSKLLLIKNKEINKIPSISREVEELAAQWKYDSEKLLNILEQLTDMQRIEIKSICCKILGIL